MPLAISVDAVFLDFDGVILDSVSIKSDAFRSILEEIDTGCAESAMEYFMRNGGISRRIKFQYIWEEMLGRPANPAAIEKLAHEFQERVYGRMLDCPYVAGAREFLEACHDRWPLFVISGTPQHELQEIVDAREMNRYFEGVFGSPRGKVEIGNDILGERGYSTTNVCLVGDATTDRDAARSLGIRFVGIDGPHLTPFLDGSECVIEDLTTLASVITSNGDHTLIDGNSSGT